MVVEELKTANLQETNLDTASLVYYTLWISDLLFVSNSFSWFSLKKAIILLASEPNVFAQISTYMIDLVLVFDV